MVKVDHHRCLLIDEVYPKKNSLGGEKVAAAAEFPLISAADFTFAATFFRGMKPSSATAYLCLPMYLYFTAMCNYFPNFLLKNTISGYLVSIWVVFQA